MTSKVPFKSTDVRGFRGGLFHAATDGQIRAYEANLAGGMDEDKAFELLSEAVRYSGRGIVGPVELIDVRGEL